MYTRLVSVHESVECDDMASFVMAHRDMLMCMGMVVLMCMGMVVLMCMHTKTERTSA